MNPPTSMEKNFTRPRCTICKTKCKIDVEQRDDLQAAAATSEIGSLAGTTTAFLYLRDVLTDIDFLPFR